MAVERINDTDTLNQGRLKINAILDQSNDSSEKVDAYQQQLNQGIASAEQIAAEAGEEAKQIATNAGQQANITANEAKGIAQNANTKSDNAVATANQNKQEFDTLRNDFDDLVAEAGDSNPEIVQARTDTTGVKQSTLANRLTIDFGDRLTNADAIQLISGETIVKKMMDFVGKTAGNTSTNPHAYFSDYTANTLKKPSATWNEVSQSDYNKLASRDDSGISTGSTSAGIIPQQMAKHNVTATAKSLSPQLFEQMDEEEAVQYVRDNFVSFTTTMRGKASSPNNKNLKAAIYMPTTDSWSTITQQDATEYTDFTVQINDNQYITDDGYIYILYYSDSSNGVTPANIDIDYAGTALSIMINAQEVLKSSGFVDTEQLSAKADQVSLTTHTKDIENPHKVTAEQVGLGDVANYNIASQAEAEAGTAADKYMTPQRTKQAIRSINAYEMLFNGDISIDDGQITLNRSIQGFKLIQVTLSINGNRITANYYQNASVSSFEGRISGVNLTDSPNSPDWQLYEVVFNVSSDKFRITVAKYVTQNGSVTNNSSNARLTNIICWY